MKLLKRAMSFILAGAITISGLTGTHFSHAYAESSDPPAASDSAGDTTTTDPGGDVGDITEEYQPVDTSKDYIRWTGKDKFATGKNYYVDSTVKISKSKTFTLPKNSTLVLSKGANIQIYASSRLNIKGSLIIEPGAKITVTGTLYFYSGSCTENYGSLTTTKSGILKISSDITNRSQGKIILSGTTCIYKTGTLANEGRTTLAANSQTTVTGKLMGTESSKLFVKGKLSITLSGSSSLKGYVYLSGTLLNSGLLIFEEGLKYILATGGKLSVTKSSRFYDNRNGNNPFDDSGLPPSNEPGEEPVELKGIDVSQYQGTINWSKVKSAGIDFAMVRTSLSYRRYDETYDYNIREAQKAGIMVGAYHYCFAENVSEAKRELDHLLKILAPYELDFPIAIDIEERAQMELGKKKLTEVAKTMLDGLKEAGYYPILYSSSTWFADAFDMSQLQDYDVWVADWRGYMGYKENAGIWQYSCEGKVSGISEDVDLDIGYKDYSKIIKEGGYNKAKTTTTTTTQ